MTLQIINIPDYLFVRKDRLHAQHEGVCKYINDGLAHRLPRGFSCLIIAVVYHPPTSDDEYLSNYLLDTLGIIENSLPSAAIFITGDFNRLNISHLKCQFQLK